MDKRYQVFVSSTYEDLQEERQQVMHALLELDCIPAGMELFPAADEDQWTLIGKVIEDCDYYVVIVGGRYGSVDGAGMGYTEKEYRYALERGKPIVAFLHKDPDSLPVKRAEADPGLKAKLIAFRELCEKKMCKYWASPAELGSMVSRSLVRLTKTHAAVGWVRGDMVPDTETTSEMLRLQRRIQELELALKRASSNPPPGAEGLAQGDDVHQLEYDFSCYDTDDELQHYQASYPTTWNDLFSVVSPLLIQEASEYQMREVLNAFVEAKSIPSLRRQKKLARAELNDFQISDTAFQTIKVQLRALGLIAQSVRQRSVKDSATYWTLTPYGDMVMTQLRAIRSNQA
jgi:hypothetical protein